MSISTRSGGHHRERGDVREGMRRRGLEGGWRREDVEKNVRWMERGRERQDTEDRACIPGREGMEKRTWGRECEGRDVDDGA